MKCRFGRVMGTKGGAGGGRGAQGGAHRGEPHQTDGTGNGFGASDHSSNSSGLLTYGLASLKACEGAGHEAVTRGVVSPVPRSRAFRPSAWRDLSAGVGSVANPCLALEDKGTSAILGLGQDLTQVGSMLAEGLALSVVSRIGA